MNALRSRFWIAGMTGLGLVAMIAFPLASRAVAQPGVPKAGKPRLDVGKGAIERPTEALLANAFYAASVNPKVEPGKVRWHADFTTARTASAKSGKPVLLFQMMGKLDEQFC